MIRLLPPVQPGRALLTVFLALIVGGCASAPPSGEIVVDERPLGAAPGEAPKPAQPQLPAVAAPPVTPLPAPPKATPIAPTPSLYPGEKEGRAAVTRLLPQRIPDSSGWAADIFSAFAALRIPATTQNFCSAIAVIEQESGFQADPAVPGLSRIVWKEIETRRKKYGIPKLVLDAALQKSSPDGRSYKARINGLKTEKQMNALYEDMISELPHGKTLLSGYNPVRTGGPMQVSVEFAAALASSKPYPYPRKGSIRDEVFTRKGGVYFGIADLLDYPAPYSQPVFRFADYNAGRYSSRNAAFQAALLKLSGRTLDLDGDLLRYQNGVPNAEESATQRALLPLAGRLRMSKAEMLRDLRQEKTAAFAQTPLYQRVFALADPMAGGHAAREAVPQINLKSPKIHRRLTTEWFAKRVDSRYRNCLVREGIPSEGGRL